MQSFLTWWTQEVASLFDWMAVLILSVPLIALAIWTGIFAMHRYWMMHLPYEERLKIVRESKK